MQLLIGILAAILLIGGLVFAVRRNGTVRVSTSYSNAQAAGSVVHAVMRGKLVVMYPNRNGHLLKASVVGFRRDGRVKLHVGHPRNAVFSRHPSELHSVSS